jgi:hypothetical protein
LVVRTIRRHLQAGAAEPRLIPEADRELVDRYLWRVTLSAKKVMVQIRHEVEHADPAIAHDPGGESIGGISAPESTIVVPWTSPSANPARGIIHVPAHNTPLKPGSRETLLIAVARARRWIKDLASGRIDIADIADREGKAEGHVRRLVTLAFASPRIVTAIIDGSVPAGLSATALARGLPDSWAEQERRFGVGQHTGGVAERQST